MVFPIITTKPSLCQHFHCCYSTAASTQELNSKGNLTELLKNKFYPAIIHTELLHHFLCRHVLYILLLKDTNPISVKGSNSIYLYVPYKSRKNISSLPKHVYQTTVAISAQGNPLIFTTLNALFFHNTQNMQR